MRPTVTARRLTPRPATPMNRNGWASFLIMTGGSVGEIRASGDIGLGDCSAACSQRAAAPSTSSRRVPGPGGWGCLTHHGPPDVDGGGKRKAPPWTGLPQRDRPGMGCRDRGCGIAHNEGAPFRNPTGKKKPRQCGRGVDGSHETGADPSTAGRVRPGGL
jgi:hypothetical protein